MNTRSTRSTRNNFVFLDYQGNEVFENQSDNIDVPETPKTTQKHRYNLQLLQLLQRRKNLLTLEVVHKMFVQFLLFSKHQNHLKGQLYMKQKMIVL